MTIEELHVSGNFEWFVYLAVSLLSRKFHSPSLSLSLSPLHTPKRDGYLRMH